MMNPNIDGKTPLPREDDYERVIAQTIQSEGINSYGAMENAMDRARSRDPAYKRFMGLISHVGMFIEPMDRMTKTYVDEELQTAEAVVLGAAFGGLMVPKLHGPVVVLDKIKINTPKAIWDSEDTPDAREAMSRYLADYGRYGLEIVGERAENLLEETESQIIADVTKQRMFRLGCGIVVAATLYEHILYNQQKEQEYLEKQLDDGINWDQELRGLLTGEDHEPLESNE